jgi:hypothetical protein
MLDLNIQDLRKKALVRFSAKPEGHVFTVHRLGAGAELELSKLSREANKLILELEAKPDQAALENIFVKINELDERRHKIKASVFDDGGDGSMALALAGELSDAELTKIVEAVEKQESIVDEPEAKPDGKTS